MDARKTKLTRDDAIALARRADKVVVAKCKQVRTFAVKSDPEKIEGLLPAMLGPTGNLRAPAILKGKTLYVGFNKEAFDNAFA